MGEDSDFAKKLLNLDPDKLKQVADLVDNLSQDSTPKKEQPHRRRRKKKKKIILPGEENDQPNPNPNRNKARGRSEPKSKELVPGVRKGSGRTSKGAASIPQAMHVGQRPNKFLQSKDYYKHKNDTETDRKLWGKNTPEERRDEMIFHEVQCIKCRLWFEVPEQFLYKEDGQIRYRCNQCAQSGM